MSDPRPSPKKALTPSSRPSEYENVYVSGHPVLKHKLTLLRNKDTPTPVFRQLLRELTFYLGSVSPFPPLPSPLLCICPVFVFRAAALCVRECVRPTAGTRRRRHTPHAATQAEVEVAAAGNVRCPRHCAACEALQTLPRPRQPCFCRFGLPAMSPGRRLLSFRTFPQTQNIFLRALGVDFLVQSFFFSFF